MREVFKEREVDEFAGDVLKGLSASPKKLYSKYLYDDKGSKLFEEIMHLPEYYPTKCEFQILEKYKSQILEFCSAGEDLDVIDLGAGNGLKAMILIKFFLRRITFRYVPVDISSSTIQNLSATLKKTFPSLSVKGIESEYIQALETLQQSPQKKLILLLGSNIGNFSYKEAKGFLKEIRKFLNKGDLLMIGFDLKKEPAVIRKAYNDSKGVTAEFNLNILKRINTDLGSRFDIRKFMFYPSYDPETGEMKSYLVSKEKQEIYISKLNKSFHFDRWETIHTECSNKFEIKGIEKLAVHTGFSVEANFYDDKEYFVDSLWQAD